jgi:glycosyltransferase involved in cell wall biosynthesis
MENKEWPLISVITPVCNGARYFDDAIQSVLAQNYPNFEHIVVDGSSTDGTIEILRKYPHLKWISEPDRGQSDAMNKGFAMSFGDIIVYLCADDYFEPGAFFTAVKHLDRSKGICYIVGECNVVDEKGQRLYGHEGMRVDFWSMLQYWRYKFPQNWTAIFYYREVQEKVGLWDIRLHYAMDYDFLLRSALLYNIVVIPEVLGNFRYIPGTKTYEQGAHPRHLTPVSKKYWKYLSPGKKLSLNWDYYNWRFHSWTHSKIPFPAKQVYRCLRKLIKNRAEMQ